MAGAVGLPPFYRAAGSSGRKIAAILRYDANPCFPLTRPEKLFKSLLRGLTVTERGTALQVKHLCM